MNGPPLAARAYVFLTAHFGGWELSAFVHSLHGHWMHVVVRNLDNVYLDRLIQRYRSMHGNTTVSKDNFVRGLLQAMKAGEMVGLLMDTNMTPPQGVCSLISSAFPPAPPAAWPELHYAPDAAVVPGFTIWDPTSAQIPTALRSRCQSGAHRQRRRRYRHQHSDIHQNHRGLCARYPDQWLWVHRRWKTRPPG
jgi:KDO2-lipid IV(A) lauroyltransferase